MCAQAATPRHPLSRSSWIRHRSISRLMRCHHCVIVARTSVESNETSLPEWPPVPTFRH